MLSIAAKYIQSETYKFRGYHDINIIYYALLLLDGEINTNNIFIHPGSANIDTWESDLVQISGRGIDNIEIVNGNITISYDDDTPDVGPVDITGPPGADGINACLPNTGMWASVNQDPTGSGQFKVFKAADGTNFLQ